MAVAVWLVLLLPHVLGIVGLWRMEIFRREAFGNLRAGTRWMMASVLLGLGYYSLVLLAVRSSGWIAAMQAWPLTPMAWVLYLQSVFACAALGAFMLAGDRVWRITVPQHPGAPPPKP